MLDAMNMEASDVFRSNRIITRVFNQDYFIVTSDKKKLWFQKENVL